MVLIVKSEKWIRTSGLLWFFILFLWITESHQAVQYTKTVDMAGQGCDEQGAVQITDTDVVQVYAIPPQLPSGEGTRDSCTVELTTDRGRRIRIYIIDIVIYDCGTFIKIFDTEQQMVKPRWTLDCNTKPQQKFTSSYSRVLIKLEKLSAQSINFKYSFALTTTQGPDVEFEQAETNFRQEILTDGAIAGIGVAAAVVLLAIILIIIFLVVRLKKMRREEDELAMSTKGSTVAQSHTTFPSYHSRHYSHNNSQDMSSVDSRDAPYVNGFNNGAYKDDSPNKEVKSILKTEKIEERKVNKSPYIIRQSHRESNRSLDKPCLEDTDVSEGDYYSDSDKVRKKKRRAHRERSKSTGHSDNERNEVKDRPRERSRTRSERSRLQSETEKVPRSRSDDPLRERGRHRELSRHRDDDDHEYNARREKERERERIKEKEREREREREKEERERERERERDREYEREDRKARARERDYESDDYIERGRGREKERGRSQTRNRSVSEKRIDKQRERERSRSPGSRHGSTSAVYQSKPRSSSSSSRHQSQSQPEKYSSHSRHKTPSTGGRSDVSDGLRRERRSSERSGFNRARTPSVGSRTDKNRSSLRRPRRT